MNSLTKSESQLVAELQQQSINNIVEGFGLDLIRKVGWKENKSGYISVLKRKGALKVLEEKYNPSNYRICPYKWEVTTTILPSHLKDNKYTERYIENVEPIKEKIYETIKANANNGIIETTKKALSRLVGVFYPSKKVDSAIEQLKQEHKIEEIGIKEDKFTWIVKEVNNEIDRLFGDIQKEDMMNAIYNDPNLSKEDNELVASIILPIRASGEAYKRQQDTIIELKDKCVYLERRVNILDLENTALRKSIQYIKYEQDKGER